MKMTNKIAAAIAAALVLLMAGTAHAVEPGDVVKYQRGKTFHVELMAFQPDSCTERCRQERAGKNYPVSYAYPVFDKCIGKGSTRYAEAGSVSVTVKGLKDGVSLASVMLLETDNRNNDRLVRFVSPSTTAAGSVTFTGIPIGERVRSLVIPSDWFDSKKDQVVKVDRETGPSFQGKFALDANTLLAPMSHRTKPNKEKVNVGMLVPIETRN